MNIYTDIRSMVSAQQAYEAYQGPVSSNNRVCCIWHDDAHPSLSFKGQYCKCFACNAGGSAIDITMRLFDLTAWQAALKLNSDFNLGLSVQAHAVQRSDYQTRRQASDALNIWERRAHTILSSYFRLLSSSIYDYAPTSPDDEEHPLFVEALRERANVEMYMDALSADKVKFFKQFRGVVDRYASRLHYWHERGITDC